MCNFKTTLFIFLILSLTVCQPVEVKLPDTHTPVVEAYLFAGKTLDSIRITETYSYTSTDTNLLTLDQLDVSVSDGINVYKLNSIGQGYYQNNEHIIESGKQYSLNFTYNQLPVSATTFIPEKNTAAISVTEIEIEQITEFPGPGGGFQQNQESVDIQWGNSGDYYYVVLQNKEENPEYINTFLNSVRFRPQFRIISKPTITDFYSINPQRDLPQYGQYRIIVFRVNPEYASLYEISNNTSQSIAQPPTNITNGLGIFTGVSSDTLFLKVIKK